MSGSREGGLKAAATNKLEYGNDYYVKIGSKGGKKSIGGFAKMDPARVVELGKKGGRARWKKKSLFTSFLEGFSRGR